MTGDLEDGDYEAYRLQASGVGETPESLTLKLLNDGEVQKSTDTPEEDQDIWMVQVGEFPDFPGS